MQDIEEILRRFKDLEDRLESKVEYSVYDNEIAQLRAMIGEIDDEERKARITASL
jgi:hypothetical protein